MVAKGPEPKLFVISGPSGAGKSSLVEELIKQIPKLKKSVSVTTRPPRRHEKDKIHYYFVTEDEFWERVKKGELLEWAQVHGFHYGTPYSFIEESLKQHQSVVLEVDVQGAAAIKKARPEAVLIFILPPTLEDLRERLKKRATEDQEAMKVRLKNALTELEEMPKYEYILVNDDFTLATKKLVEIVKKELSKVGS
jgi:guanylate kinase